MSATDTTQADHGTLLDALACRTLWETYSFAEITQDLDLFMSLWTDDAVLGTASGRDEIRGLALGFFEITGERISDLRVSPAGWHVEVDGDVAHGQFYLVSQFKIPQADGTFRIAHMDGSYRIDFRRTNEGWRMSRMGGIKDPDAPHDTAIMAQLAYEEISL